MTLRTATLSDLKEWSELRALLWPDTSLDHHRKEAEAMLSQPIEESIVVLEVSETGIRAFAEATLRFDYVNGCDTSPVAFLEGIFVREEVRGSGVGRGLLEVVRDWAKERGCLELASDADIDNTASHAFHRALGFAETQRTVFFRQKL